MADQVLYQTRRTLDESSDKLEDDDINPVNERLDELEKLVQDDEGKPLETRAVIAAHAPGMHITSNPFNLAVLIISSPGSQIPGMPASLTNAIDLPFVRLSII